MSDAPATVTEFVTRKPSYVQRGSRWPEGDAELTRRWLAGETTGTIARAMRLTRNQVVGRVRIICLPRRPSPIKGAHARSGPRNGKCALEHAMKVTMPETRAIAGGREIPVAQYEGRRLPVRGPTLDATPRVYVPPRVSASATCQFPMWANGERPPKPPLFCGQPSVVGMSWCPQCLKKVSGGRVSVA